MKKGLILLLSVFISFSAFAKKEVSPFYSFNANSIQDKKVSMKSYKGKVVLIVNTASKCGFTSQYEGLEELYKKYKDRGLVVLGFPCNQFGNQEPGTAEEIASFCNLKFGVTFPMFQKVDVNGENADPLFKYLKSSVPGSNGADVKWNFTKFLVDRQGNPVKRYESRTKPQDIAEEIERLLAAR